MRFVPLTILALALPALAHTEDQNPITAPSSLSIPLLGYGTWNLDKSNASEAVSIALETGYKHIDCAAIYGNEKEVGKGIAHGLKKAGLHRSDVWVTSKLWNDHHAPDLVAKGLAKTLENLGLEYLDLYLMHWPVGSHGGKNEFDYVETWHAMERLLHTSKVRHIGVSNFSPTEMAHLIKSSKTKPAVHQMELHPYLPQNEWVQWHHAHGIHVTAYSPFGNANPTYGPPSKDSPPPLLENKAMRRIAKEGGCTTAQVALAWGMSRGTSVIPKSGHAERIKENYGALECDLEYEDFTDIAELGKKYLKRFNNPSQGWGVDLYEGLEDA
ncbi:MAG: hypothetical protein M1827_002162 [Pycnora praestabilis]|nr:MAG: hypothetical protein M1827_002162 [Pycnora praestabilis]